MNPANNNNNNNKYQQAAIQKLEFLKILSSPERINLPVVAVYDPHHAKDLVFSVLRDNFTSQVRRDDCVVRPVFEYYHDPAKFANISVNDRDRPALFLMLLDVEKLSSRREQAQLVQHWMEREKIATSLERCLALLVHPQCTGKQPLPDQKRGFFTSNPQEKAEKLLAEAIEWFAKNQPNLPVEVFHSIKTPSSIEGNLIVGRMAYCESWQNSSDPKRYFTYDGVAYRYLRFGMLGHAQQIYSRPMTARLFLNSSNALQSDSWQRLSDADVLARLAEEMASQPLGRYMFPSGNRNWPSIRKPSAPATVFNSSGGAAAVAAVTVIGDPHLLDVMTHSLTCSILVLLRMNNAEGACQLSTPHFELLYDAFREAKNVSPVVSSLYVYQFSAAFLRMLRESLQDDDTRFLDFNISFVEAIIFCRNALVRSAVYFGVEVPAILIREAITATCPPPPPASSSTPTIKNNNNSESQPSSPSPIDPKAEFLRQQLRQIDPALLSSHTKIREELIHLTQQASLIALQGNRRRMHVQLECQTIELMLHDVPGEAGVRCGGLLATLRRERWSYVVSYLSRLQLRCETRSPGSVSRDQIVASCLRILALSRNETERTRIWNALLVVGRNDPTITLDLDAASSFSSATVSSSASLHQHQQHVKARRWVRSASIRNEEELEPSSHPSLRCAVNTAIKITLFLRMPVSGVKIADCRLWLVCEGLNGKLERLCIKGSVGGTLPSFAFAVGTNNNQNNATTSPKKTSSRDITLDFGCVPEFAGAYYLQQLYVRCEGVAGSARLLKFFPTPKKFFSNVVISSPPTISIQQQNVPSSSSSTPPPSAATTTTISGNNGVVEHQEKGKILSNHNKKQISHIDPTFGTADQVTPVSAMSSGPEPNYTSSNNHQPNRTPTTKDLLLPPQIANNNNNNNLSMNATNTKHNNNNNQFANTSSSLSIAASLATNDPSQLWFIMSCEPEADVNFDVKIVGDAIRFSDPRAPTPKLQVGIKNNDTLSEKPTKIEMLLVPATLRTPSHGRTLSTTSYAGLTRDEGEKFLELRRKFRANHVALMPLEHLQQQQQQQSSQNIRVVCDIEHVLQEEQEMKEKEANGVSGCNNNTSSTQLSEKEKSQQQQNQRQSHNQSIVDEPITDALDPSIGCMSIFCAPDDFATVLLGNHFLHEEQQQQLTADNDKNDSVETMAVVSSQSSRSRNSSSSSSSLSSSRGTGSRHSGGSSSKSVNNKEDYNSDDEIAEITPSRNNKNKNNISKKRKSANKSNNDNDPLLASPTLGVGVHPLSSIDESGFLKSPGRPQRSKKPTTYDDAENDDNATHVIHHSPESVAERQSKKTTSAEALDQIYAATSSLVRMASALYPSPQTAAVVNLLRQNNNAAKSSPNDNKNNSNNNAYSKTTSAFTPPALTGVSPRNQNLISELENEDNMNILFRTTTGLDLQAIMNGRSLDDDDYNEGGEENDGSKNKKTKNMEKKKQNNNNNNNNNVTGTGGELLLTSFSESAGAATGKNIPVKTSMKNNNNKNFGGKQLTVITSPTKSQRQLQQTQLQYLSPTKRRPTRRSVSYEAIVQLLENAKLTSPHHRGLLYQNALDLLIAYNKITPEQVYEKIPRTSVYHTLAPVPQLQQNNNNSLLLANNINSNTATLEQLQQLFGHNNKMLPTSPNSPLLQHGKRISNPPSATGPTAAAVSLFTPGRVEVEVPVPPLLRAGGTARLLWTYVKLGELREMHTYYKIDAASPFSVKYTIRPFRGRLFCSALVSNTLQHTALGIVEAVLECLPPNRNNSNNNSKKKRSGGTMNDKSEMKKEISNNSNNNTNRNNNTNISLLHVVKGSRVQLPAKIEPRSTQEISFLFEVAPKRKDPQNPNSPMLLELDDEDDLKHPLRLNLKFSAWNVVEKKLATSQLLKTNNDDDHGDDVDDDKFDQGIESSNNNILLDTFHGPLVETDYSKIRPFSALLQYESESTTAATSATALVLTTPEPLQFDGIMGGKSGVFGPQPPTPQHHHHQHQHQSTSVHENNNYHIHHDGSSAAPTSSSSSSSSVLVHKPVRFFLSIQARTGAPLAPEHRQLRFRIAADPRYWLPVGQTERLLSFSSNTCQVLLRLDVVPLVPGELKLPGIVLTLPNDDSVIVPVDLVVSQTAIVVRSY